jgi:hypothetical protein
MTPTPRASCHRCGTVLATDQEYCVECGARRVSEDPRPWRIPLIAALAVIVAMGGLALLAYRGLVHDANKTAAAPAKTVAR